MAIECFCLQYINNDVPKKNKFHKQEHRSFIDWFIALSAKITISEYQIELKMFEHHFYNDV